MVLTVAAIVLSASPIQDLQIHLSDEPVGEKVSAAAIPDHVVIDGDQVLVIDSQADARIESIGDIVIRGTVIVRPGMNERDTPCLMLKAKGSVIIEGSIQLADGGDSVSLWHRGGRGGSLVVDAPLLVLSKDLRAGNGGQGGPMGEGGPGGAVTVRGVALGFDGRHVSIYGGHGADGSDGLDGDWSHPDGYPGGAGGQGGIVLLEGGWLDRPSELKLPNDVRGLNGASAVGGNGGRGGAGGDGKLELDEFAVGGNGGRGGNGGEAHASGGAIGKAGSDGCGDGERPSNGSPGGFGGAATGGVGGEGGSAGEPVRSLYLTRYGGNGGRGGSAIGGAGADGGPGGRGITPARGGRGGAAGQGEGGSGGDGGHPSGNGGASGDSTSGNGGSPGPSGTECL